MQGKLSRAARMLLGFTALMGAVNSAVAAGNQISLGGKETWTVYAFGNAQAVADAFRALSNFTASGTFQSIVSMVAVLGVLGIGASGGFNPSQARKLIGYFVGVALTCYFLFGVGNGGPLVVNVEVIDTVDMTWKAPVTVPAVVGIPASIISSAGYSITKSIEASFALPDELKMSNGAPFNLAASMIADASQARISDPNLASSLAYYVQDCFTIGVARGNLVADTLINSTDFLNDIRFDSESVMVNTMLEPPVGQAGVVTCKQAWKLINDAVTASGTGAASFLTNASAWTKTPAMSVVNAAADRTAQWASNNGVTDGGAIVKQAAVLSAFRGAYSQAASQTGNSEFLTGVAITQATESQRSSWITGAEVFNKSMGYIFAILQVFVYAITPLILCAALVPGLGLALLKNFSQILLWLAIWQPMLAIVNFIVISMQQAELGGIMSNSGAYGFTLSNMGLVTEKSANLRAAATFVGTMVPALAWAMVKGSMDFSRVIGSAVGENFAQGAANTMTTGNYSLNSASMDSFTANKHSVASSGAWGSGHTTADSTASREHNLGGSGMATAHNERLALATTSNMQTNEGSQGGTTAGTSAAGSGATGVTKANSVTNAAVDATAGGHAKSSAATSGITGNVGGSLSVKPSGGGKADGAPSNANGQGNNGTGGTPPSNPVVLKGLMERATDALNPQVSGGVTAMIGGNKAETDTLTKTSTVSNTGATTDTGNKATNFTEGASRGETVGQTHGAQTGDAQNITGINSAFSRAQMQSSYMRMNNFMTQGKWGRQEIASSHLGDKVQQLGEHGAVPKAVAAEFSRNDKREDELGDKVDAFKSKAEAGYKRVESAADQIKAREKGDVAAAEAPATKTATSRIGDTIAENYKDAKETAKDVYNGAKDLGAKAVEKLSNPRPEGSVSPTVTARPESGESARKDARLANTMGSMMSGNPMLGRQPAPEQQPGAQADQRQQLAANSQKPADRNSQAPGAQAHDQRQQPADRNNQAPGAHAQDQRQQLAANNQQPADRNSQAPGAQNPDQRQQLAANSQKPDDRNAHQVAANGQKPNERNSQAPGGLPQDERNQLAQGGDQQQRERELQDRQERQLAATNAVGQALQATQMMPQSGQVPTGQPPLTGMENTPQLAAAAQQQQQQPGVNAGVPNPFSGEKADASEGQLQGQVQMAEQRAERMGTQLKGVDGMLASADGRKPSELPELINQARDMVRNA